MNININVDDIDKLNTRNFHELTTTVERSILIRDFN